MAVQMMKLFLKRNVESYNQCDLIPNVMRGVDKVDLSVSLMGKIKVYLFFYHQLHYKDCSISNGEMAVGAAAEKFNTFFGISSLSTVSAEKISNLGGPKIFNFTYKR